MAVAITATAQGDWPVRVLISVTGLAIGDAVDIYRVVGGERTKVRAASADFVADTSFLRTDAELPFGVPVSYLAMVNGTDQYSTSATTYTLDGGKVALTDAINGNSAEVVILAWDEERYTPNTSLFKVGGRNVVVSGDFGMFEGDIELYTETTSSRDNAVDLLRNATEGTIQLRQAGGYDGYDSYLAILGTAVRKFSQDGSDQRRLITLNVAEVEGWAPALEAQGETLQDIADAYTSATLAHASQFTFASTAEGWTASGGTVARVATPSNVGDGSLRLTPTGGVAALAGSPITTLTSGGAGSTYTLTMLVQTTATWDVRVRINWYNASGVAVGASLGGLQSAPAATWTTFTATGIAPANTAKFALVLEPTGNPAASNLHYIDWAKLELVTSLNDLSNDYATLLAIAQAEFA